MYQQNYKPAPAVTPLRKRLEQIAGIAVSIIIGLALAVILIENLSA